MRTEHSTHTSPFGDTNGCLGIRLSGRKALRVVRARVARWFGCGFYACGGRGLPPEILYLGRWYLLERVLKHDFHAATAIYKRACEASSSKLEVESQPDLSDVKFPFRLVGKISRRTHFCFLPLGWLGRLMTRKEIRHLRRCEGIGEVPQVLARVGPNMYVYEYIEGTSLGDRPALPADFFDRLLASVREIHARHLVHFDLHKPGNILVDREGRPHVIDFQLSLHIGDRFLLSRWLSLRLRQRLQAYDLYHIYKHKRRFQPDLLTEDQERLSRDRSLPLKIHRALAKPYKRVRRACLRYLCAKGILSKDETAPACSETDPARWAKK